MIWYTIRFREISAWTEKSVSREVNSALSFLSLSLSLSHTHERDREKRGGRGVREELLENENGLLAVSLELSMTVLWINHWYCRSLTLEISLDVCQSKFLFSSYSHANNYWENMNDFSFATNSTTLAKKKSTFVLKFSHFSFIQLFWQLLILFTTNVVHWLQQWVAWVAIACCLLKSFNRVLRLHFPLFVIVPVLALCDAFHLFCVRFLNLYSLLNWCSRISHEFSRHLIKSFANLWNSLQFS